MMCPDQPDRQSVQIRRLVLRATGVLIEGEKVLTESRALIVREKMLLGLGILDKVGKMLSSGALAVIWCSWGLFS